jgi:hypothetical protein
MGEFRMKCYFSSQNPNPWVALSNQLNRVSLRCLLLGLLGAFGCRGIERRWFVCLWALYWALPGDLWTFLLPVRIVAVSHLEVQVLDLEARRESWHQFAAILIRVFFTSCCGGGSLRLVAFCLLFIGWVVSVWLAFVCRHCIRLCFIGLMLPRSCSFPTVLVLLSFHVLLVTRV